MALPPSEVAKHIEAFEREGEASVRARLEARQTLKPESYLGEVAYKWLEEKRLSRERAAMDATRKPVTANRSTAGWTCG